MAKHHCTALVGSVDSTPLLMMQLLILGLLFTSQRRVYIMLYYPFIMCPTYKKVAISWTPNSALYRGYNVLICHNKHAHPLEVKEVLL